MSSNPDNLEIDTEISEQDVKTQDSEKYHEKPAVTEEAKFQEENHELPEKPNSPPTRTSPTNPHSKTDTLNRDLLIPDHSHSSPSNTITASTLNSIAADFNNDDHLIINSSLFSHNSINWNSRSLQVTDKDLFLTGGKSNKSCFTLNTETKGLISLQDLIIGRSLHAMSWINNFPAVIGGLRDNEQTLGSVEIYSNHAWTELEPLKYPRYGHAATHHANKTWVVGGARSPTEGELNIEVYEHTKWTVLAVQLQSSIVGLGLFAVNEEIYVLGGFSISKKNTEEVSVLNIANHTWTKAKNHLSEPACFTQNLWSSHHHTFETFAFKGPKVVYDTLA